MATGDTVMKSGVARDAVATAEGIIAFEMEAAGIWEQLPTIIIKAVCDYADSHKNKKWQTYAAGAAAAAAKAVAAFHTPADKPRLRELKAAQRESILPFPPDPEFISRPEISDWIKDKAKIPGGRAALVGLGGIGKSQLAIRHAHGVRNRSHVFWINATTRATLEESVRTIADGLNLEKPGDSLDDLFRRVGGWLGREQNGPWTVVLDNFDDASVLTDDDPRLRKLLPINGNGFTLITSRDVKAAELLTGSGKNLIYLVPDLGEEAAVELFQGKLENPCEREEAEEVVRLLEFMPLAISQAAAYLNSRADRVSVRDYADMFRAGAEKRGALLEWEYDELRRYQTSSNSIFGTWTITLEQMQREQPSAVDLLSLMSWFNSQSIPEWALKPQYMDNIASYLPDFTYRDIMPPSVTSLMSRVSIGRRFLHQSSMDRGFRRELWSVWATPGQKEKDKEESKEDPKEETGKAKAGKPTKPKKPKKPKTSGWSDMTKLAGKALRLQSKKRKEDLKEALSREQLSKYKDEILHGYTPSLDSDDESPDGAAEALAQDLDVLRKYSMVTPTAQDGVLKMHPLVRYCTHNWLSRSGNLDAWKRRFLTVMVACFEGPPAGHELHTGDLDGHIEFLADEEPGDVATARLWEAVCDHLVGRWDERGAKDPAAVVALQEKMVAVSDKMFGHGDRITIGNREWLARHALERGELEKAEAMFKEVLKQAQDAHGALSFEVVECQFQYVKTLRAQGRVGEATRITDTMYEKLAKAYFPDWIQWMFAAHSTAAHAESMAAEGRFDDAARLAMEALDNPWFERGLVSSILDCLAGVTEAMSRHSPPEEAVPLLFNIVNQAERVDIVWKHIPFAVCGPFYRHLAACLERQGDLAGALLVMRKGISNMAFSLLGPTLPARAIAQDLLDAPAGEDETRERLLQELVQCLDSEEGRFSDVFLEALANIARCLYSLDRFDECWALLDALCGHLLAEWGETHRLTKKVLGFRDDMKEWHVEAGRMAGEAGDKEPAAPQEVGSAVATDLEGQRLEIAAPAENKGAESVVVVVGEREGALATDCDVKG